jgi:hypothetical protein
MSTDHGLTGLIGDAVRSEVVELQTDAQAIQVDFLDEPWTSGEVLVAREELGPDAGALAVGRHVSNQRRGRKKGRPNRNTSDLVAYLSQFGPDPLVAAMKIIAEPEEFIVERSRVIDPPKKRLGIAEARAHRMRMIELLAPYFHGKKPVQIQLDASGDFNLLIPGINISEVDAAKMAAGEFVLEAEYLDVDDGEGGNG